MSDPNRGIRDAATVGLAVAAPAALFSGIGVGVTLISGPPAFLVVVLVGALGTIVACLLVLAADNARRAAQHRSRDEDDDGGPV